MGCCKALLHHLGLQQTYKKLRKRGGVLMKGVKGIYGRNERVGVENAGDKSADIGPKFWDWHEILALALSDWLEMETEGSAKDGPGPTRFSHVAQPCGLQAKEGGSNGPLKKVLLNRIQLGWDWDILFFFS
ncbi:hypothetical protein Salat_1577300 [Sesamum alatum]|uniref:Uncharacterized protein n=1 Tax=Sesamum alatum TaxID=300844 RepID=A0AAE1YEC2_9LAMI|nr:hypothetical protein Salat_1577300 [Sesamum alatum]